MRFRWTISARIVAVAWIAVTLTVIAGLAIQKSIIRQQGIEAVRGTMRSVLLSAESARDSAANLQSSLDHKKLAADAQGAKDFRATKLYNSAPIMVVWKSVAKGALAEGFTLRVPAKTPRNPTDLPTPEELGILDKLARERSQEFF